MSREFGGFIESTSDAANIPIVRDPRSEPLKFHPEDESERIASAYDRNAAARGIQIVREDALRDAREAAFRKAIRGLQLTPEQISARVQQLFAPSTEPEPAEKSEGATTISTTQPGAGMATAAATAS